MEQVNPNGVFINAFILTALAGFAALLRSGKPITIMGVLSAILNGGMMGLGLTLLWYKKFQENSYFLIGVCIIAGLGGMTTLDFVINAFRKGGLSIKLGSDKESEKENES